MSGYARPKGKDRWQLQVYNGQIKDGKRVKLYETVEGSTKRLNPKGKPIPPPKVKMALSKLVVSVHDGTNTPPGHLKLSELIQLWLTGYISNKTSPRTLDTITSITERHIIPILGNIQLKHLQPQNIQSYYAQVGKELSARSVHTHHRYLKQCLKWGVRHGYLARNPCELVDAPSFTCKAVRKTTVREIEILLDAALGTRFYAIIYCAISTGLRQAELLGLRYRDLDLDLASISVSQVLYKRRGLCVFKEPKTKHSKRQVSMTPKLALFLKEYKKEREAIANSLGQTLTLDDLVFANDHGNPTDPSTLTHNFQKIVKRAGLENFRFHDLRHAFSILMLNRGAKIKVISEALGHSSCAFTMDVYSSIIEGMQKEAMALLDDILPLGINSSKNKINAKLTPNIDIVTKSYPILVSSPSSSVG